MKAPKTKQRGSVLPGKFGEWIGSVSSFLENRRRCCKSRKNHNNRLDLLFAFRYSQAVEHKWVGNLEPSAVTGDIVDAFDFSSIEHRINWLVDEEAFKLATNSLGSSVSGHRLGGWIVRRDGMGRFEFILNLLSVDSARARSLFLCWNEREAELRRQP
ncbi:hypothetical protein VTL71DRAFT_8233, partial [Oculimacula yallundae]